MRAWAVLNPLRESAQGYNLKSLRGDALAGLSVSIIAVPQSMAYAAIAGVPLQYGLYTLIFQSCIGSLFSSQRFLSMGPINTQSLLVASTVTLAMRTRGDLPEDQTQALYLQLVFALTLLKGAIQLGMWGLRLGGLVRYVSSAVVIGFTAGAAVLIAAGQLPAFLGVNPARVEHELPGLVGIVQRLIPVAGAINGWTVAVGGVAVAVYVASMSLSRRLPGPLLAVLGASFFVEALGTLGRGVQRVPPLPTGLSQFRFDIPWEGLVHSQQLLGGAIALALLGLLEAYAIAKSLSARSGHPVSANQELFGQGLTHTLTGCFHAIPGSASFTRSAVNLEAGAKTGFAGVFNAGFVLLMVLLFSGYAQHIPLASLAGVLLVIAYGLVDWRSFRRIARANRADAMVCFTTFAATLLLPLSYAVFAGILLNLALYVRRTSRLHIAEMVRSGGGQFVERPLRERSGGRRVLFLQIEGDLFFGLADELRDRLASIERQRPRVVIFRLRRAYSIDSTILAEFERFVRGVKAQGGQVVLCGLRSGLLDQLRRYGLAGLIGEANLFEVGAGVFSSAKAALRRAAQIVGGSIDEQGLDVDEEDPEAPPPRAWSYDI